MELFRWHTPTPIPIRFSGAPSLTLFQGRDSFLDFLSPKLETPDLNDSSAKIKGPTLAENRKDGAPANSLTRWGVPRARSQLESVAACMYV